MKRLARTALAEKAWRRTRGRFVAGRTAHWRHEILLLSLALPSCVLQARATAVTFHTDEARATLAALQDPSLMREAALNIAQMHGNQAAIRKLDEFTVRATTQSNVPPLPAALSRSHHRQSGNDAGTWKSPDPDGLADSIAFGRQYIGNPDLPERFLAAAPLNEFDWPTVYASGRKGYSDYPVLDAMTSELTR